jgi:S1-C subfamily serine protease
MENGGSAVRRFTAYGPSIVVALFGLLVLVAAPAMVGRLRDADTAARITLARTTLDGDDILLRIDRAVTAIAETIEPSLVHIDVQSEWVDEDGSARGGSRSTGSGWVYDADGSIVTNAHVVRGARRITVQFEDGRFANAELVGIDPFTDIAVIRLEDPITVFPAPRDTGYIPRRGERVFAFGSPFGFKFSMSEGIISGLGRDPMSTAEFGGFTNFIQTDAAVNPGNSGGPLVSARGRVIGMNVAIATARDGGSGLDDAGGDSAGISFAIPLPTIETVVDQLIETGQVSRGFLGVSLIGAVGFENERGDYLRGMRVRVEPGGPSDDGGIEDGDVITAVAGQEVPEFKIFQSIVGTIPATEPVAIELYREGAARTVQVVLGELPDHVLGERARVPIMYQLGLRVGTGPRGPVVTRVFESSPADRMGFRTEQEILAVGGEPVRSFQDVFTLLTAKGLLAAKEVEVRVRSTDAEGSIDERTLKVRLGR